MVYRCVCFFFWIEFWTRQYRCNAIAFKMLQLKCQMILLPTSSWPQVSTQSQVNSVYFWCHFFVIKKIILHPPWKLKLKWIDCYQFGLDFSSINWYSWFFCYHFKAFCINHVGHIFVGFSLSKKNCAKNQIFVYIFNVKRCRHKKSAEFRIFRPQIAHR